MNGIEDQHQDPLLFIECFFGPCHNWSYVKKKYKLNVTNFPFFVIVNSLSLLRPFPSFSDIVPHIHLETNIHNDYEYGLYYRMFQYIWTVLLFQLRQ